MESQKSSSSLPEGVELFSHQAAGHKHGQGRLGIGVLKHKNGDVLKPMFDGDRRASIELSFYRNVFETNQPDILIKELRCFLPEFHGIWETNIEGKSVQYICLEDVSKNFENPSVLDVKMGCITYDDDANEDKILSQSTKFKYGEALGIRILGMKVYNDDENNYLPKIEKSFWRKLAPDTFTSGLNHFLTTNKHINMLILSGFIHKLVKLSDWFSRQRLFKFIGSSLLFVYEGTFLPWSSWSDENHINIDFSNSTETATHVDYNLCLNKADATPDFCDVCCLCRNVCSKLTDCHLYRVVMIDFSHCFPFHEEDTNYTFGLHKLIEYLRDLLKAQRES
ncbi:hypothetical protein JTE90_026738 [Oedothorax gibbosus]|uniref:Kinase n=1 Tax=Oedothorax gibbosus TaxID=931172 RepID=A0AAV6U6M0_9ARAC|nr:hypothetical protein JTE90_026738 [Oedothorax gibbosus]